MWVVAALSGRQQHRFLIALMAGQGLDVACAAAGTSVERVLWERLKNACFRGRWREADNERLDAAETLLIDQLVSALKNGKEPVPDKALLQLWQALKDERRRLNAPVTGGSTAPVAAASVDYAADERRIVELIDKVEQNLRAAEVEQGL